MHDRSNERRLLKRKLMQGISVNIPAPRRIGKTWTIKRLAEDLRDDGWQAVEIDVEGMRTPDEFASDLCKRIEAQVKFRDRFMAHIGQRFENLLGGGWGNKPLDAFGKVEPMVFAETLIASLDESDEETAIIIDEVAYFFLAMAESDQIAAHAFAYKLRALQQRYPSVRWVLTGSIGLEVIARRYGLSGAFVDFETVVLQPFTPPEARSYLRDQAIQAQLNQEFEADDDVLDYMFEELGWLAPYYLKLVANEICPSADSGHERPARATKADVDNAFAKLLSPKRKNGFEVLREHIRKNLPKPDRTIAASILDALSKTPDGEQESTLLAKAKEIEKATDRRQIKDILVVLCNDGLIVKNADRYAFQSGLFRRYWIEYEAS